MLPLKLGSLLKVEESCTLILQVGTCWLRLGLKSDQTPRVSVWIHDEIQPCLSQSPKDSVVDTCSTREQCRPILRKLLETAFGKLGEYPPDRASIILLESFRLPLPFREAMFDVLFSHFRVHTIHAAPDIIMPLLLQAQTTGLIVDIGHEEVRCVPVAFGVPIFKAAKWAPGRGYKAICDHFVRLCDADPALPSDFLQLARLVSKWCYCRFVCDNGLKFERLGPVKAGPLTLSERSRWQPFELLFNDDDKPSKPRTESLPVGELVVEVLRHIDIHLRALVVQNILITGGIAGVRGLRERTAMEILKALDEDVATKNLDRSCVAMGHTIYNPLIAQWVGGTVYAALESELKVIERGEWTWNTDTDIDDMWGMTSKREPLVTSDSDLSLPL